MGETQREGDLKRGRLGGRRFEGREDSERVETQKKRGETRKWMGGESQSGRRDWRNFKGLSEKSQFHSAP